MQWQIVQVRCSYTAWRNWLTLIPNFLSQTKFVVQLAAGSMVHWWQDPTVEARLAVLYVNIVFLLLDVYGYVSLTQEGMLDAPFV